MNELKIVETKYPSIIAIEGASFRIPIVIQANDLSFPAALERQSEAEFIVEACNNYKELKVQNAELLAACQAWLLWDSEAYAAKETGESEYSYGELQAMRQDAVYKARAVIEKSAFIKG